VFDDNPAHGIALDASQGNTVEDNTATGNGFGNQTINDSEPPYTDGFDISPGCATTTWLRSILITVNQPCVLGTTSAAKGKLMSGASGNAAVSEIHMPARRGGRASL
jgi:parallel beta-helix repeat protein